MDRTLSTTISPKKELLKAGVKQKSLDTLYSNIPKKKLEPVKPEEETKDEDLFDNESEEEEDIIAVSCYNHLSCRLEIVYAIWHCMLLVRKKNPK